MMSPVRVMLVEDDAITRRKVSRMLSRLGYHPESFETAEQGLEAFTRKRFDAVLSDIVLPGMDGLEMVRRLRAADPTLAPVIMTSRSDQEVAVRALECGVREFLSKPFSEEQLRQSMEKALAERRQALESRLLVGDLLEARSQLEEKVQVQHHQLIQTRQYLHQLLDAVPLGIVSTSREGQILTFNRGAERMYGYTAAEVLGRPVSELFDTSSPAPEQEKRLHVDKAGNSFPVLIREREIRDVAGQSFAQLYVLEDLRDRESLEKQLLYAEQLSTLGQLAPRIVHEFKTPLQLISAYVELILEELPSADKEQIRSYLEIVQPAIQQIREMVRQIASLGKPRESRLRALDLAEVVDKTLAPLEQLGALKHCRILRDYAVPLPPVQGDPGQIEQVFRNLIINAAQAMEGLDEQILTLKLAPVEHGERVEAVVGDTGCGIAPEQIEEIFQPFFTTKPESKGTGLGLSIVKTILDRHQATVRVESTVGDGTRFHLYFPAAGQAEDA